MVNRRVFIMGGVVFLLGLSEQARSAAAGHHPAAAAPGPSHPAKTTVRTVGDTAVIAKTVAFAEQQRGKPYVWAATGPDSYDCSGLVQAAYQAAGVTIPRTTYDQWAELPHVPSSQRRLGDLVFFPGSDGTWEKPGHVGLVLDKTWMIQAYEPGKPIGVYTYGLPTSLEGVRNGQIVGYARPTAA